MTDSNEEPKHVIYIKAESVQSNLQEDMSLSNETAPTSMNTSIKKEVQEATCHSDPKNLTITWKIYKDFKICIYKPLIPLKLALFFWYGDGAVITPFLTVYFKQRGLALSELSIIYMIAPVVQFIGTTLSGVIADKIGRSKPVLIGNLILTMVFVAGMLIVPRMSTESCESYSFNFECDQQTLGRLNVKTRSEVTEYTMEANFCKISCPENVTQSCPADNIMCIELAEKQNFVNLSMSVPINGTYRKNNETFDHLLSQMHKNATFSWCNESQKRNCTISCTFLSDEKCAWEAGYRWKVLVANIMLFVLYLTAYSNCYRILDVTSMSLVKEHNSDFGRERFFSILGILVFSPIAGYVVDASTTSGNEKNYASALYFFIGVLLVTLAVICKLKVKTEPPGKNMRRKTVYLIQNVDVISFILVIFVLGTSWNFTKNFTNWFLVELDTPGFLLGLIPAASSLYGLPFLLTTNWWVKKLGSSNLFILALLAYVVSALGYSFLYDPWFALLLEFTSVFTYHMLWVAVVIHSHDIAPEGLTATVISTAGAIHYSIGKGIGSLIGGLIMDAYGGRTAFRVIAIICLVAAVLYGFYVYIRLSYFRTKHYFSKKDVNGSAGCKKVTKELYTPRNGS
ncbi:major facilitator superfamily domain-containing protein 6-like [Stegodyphus dumicola]|uniref:major facilitator superfamily domain-containing protein 6-like n=1 Tax=Stegodyphus dumicola TaxID=202533 RepID=UPI0015AE3904|nr:major facilitator superfamily domain-containing protein 6-like [Stegodyphus dumicola]XP_035219880.1 major facilitator superfamily domain-containing protein 6-like [Stegodyphus dumicola]XP_035219881.1 major facilitator superfamily domain-containing protein 6-like [Stegodyphus dumicola]XP_035219882.1 major facilitator superfamily domain-containing protein 6-like [Stegodyphus dumicola]